MAMSFDKELPDRIPVKIAARVQLLLTQENAPLIGRLREVGELMNVYHGRSEGWFEVDKFRNAVGYFYRHHSMDQG
jgi:hypothetical protein